jgi:hypothetical protein
MEMDQLQGSTSRAVRGPLSWVFWWVQLIPDACRFLLQFSALCFCWRHCILTQVETDQLQVSVGRW